MFNNRVESRREVLEEKSHYRIVYFYHSSARAVFQTNIRVTHHSLCGFTRVSRAGCIQDLITHNAKCVTACQRRLRCNLNVIAMQRDQFETFIELQIRQKYITISYTYLYIDRYLNPNRTTCFISMEDVFVL